jgi:5-formyltetrahydrofolate cyclo-ligase
LPEALEPGIVLGYHPTADELDPGPAMAALRTAGWAVALPRIAGPGALTLHVVGPLEGLEQGPHGIRQPSLRAPAVARGDIALAVVPGVAFDPQCERIGYGGGYYDRLLSSMPGALRVGLAFDEQLVGHIPHEAHDCSMNAVVTPTQVLRCGDVSDEA